MRIYDEYKHAERLLERGLTRFMSGKDLYILAKYFRDLGQNDKEIELSLLDFCERKVDGFVENIHADNIIKIVKNSSKQTMRNPTPVPVTKREIDKIKELKNYRYEKIIFTMLVLGKYFKLTNTSKIPSSSKNYFVDEKFSTILRLAHSSNKKGENIEFILFRGGYIDHVNKEDDYFLIKFTDTDDISDVVVVVDDMEHIINYYPFTCEKCGKIIEKSSNRHMMCENCWKEKNKEYDRNRKK